MIRHDDAELLALAGEVAQLAIQSGTTLCTAESCTGGLVAHLLTHTPGVSAVFLGGIVAYANRAKTDLLAVGAEALEAYGAVSDPVARGMARGARSQFHANLGVSTTGVAGPGGGSAEKPVGLVYVAVRGDVVDLCSRFQFGGDRTENILAASFEALHLLRQALYVRAG